VNFASTALLHRLDEFSNSHSYWKYKSVELLLLPSVLMILELLSSTFTNLPSRTRPFLPPHSFLLLAWRFSDFVASLSQERLLLPSFGMELLRFCCFPLPGATPSSFFWHGAPQILLLPFARSDSFFLLLAWSSSDFVASLSQERLLLPHPGDAPPPGAPGAHRDR
jgi:hypothetical protein